ncbi:MAG: hypothetical protein ACRDY4_08775 [Acidimicrobiia bacterium]
MDIPKTVQDAAYVSVGVGVLAFQQAQVRRREAQADLEVKVEKARSAIARQAKDARSSLETAAREARTKAETVGGDVRERVEPLVEQLQTVPAQVKQAVEAGAARARELVGRAA